MKLNYSHTRLACYTGYIVGAIINNLPPLLFTAFKSRLGLSTEDLAFIITLNFGIQLFVDMSGTKIVDILGIRLCACLSQIFAAAGLIGLAIFPNIFPTPFSGILCGVVLYAIGSGMTEVLISPIIEALPSDSKSGSMSFLHSFYCWGSMLVALASTGFFVLFGVAKWQLLCALWAIIPILNTVLFSMVPIIKLPTDKANFSASKLLTKKVFWIFAAIMICSGASEIAMGQWASFFAEEALGVSKTVGDLLGPCLFALMMGISRVLYGVFGGKLRLERAIALSATLCIISYFITSLCPNPFISLFGCGICGFSVGIMWPGALSLSAKKYPMGGTAMFALLAMFGDIGCTLGPQVVSVMQSRISLMGSGLKAGLLCSVIFPIILVVCLGLAGSKDK